MPKKNWASAFLFCLLFGRPSMVVSFQNGHFSENRLFWRRTMVISANFGPFFVDTGIRQDFFGRLFWTP